MAQVLALDRFSAAQRLPTWRQAVCDTFVKLECKTADALLNYGRLEAGTLGDLHVARVQSSAQYVERTTALVNQASDAFVLLSIQLRGQTIVRQGASEAVLTPGSLSFYDTARPYTLGLPGDFDQIVLQVPRHSLEALTPHGLACMAMRLNANNPYAQALLALAPQLLQMAAEPETPAMKKTAAIAIDLMGLALNSLAPHEPSHMNDAVLAGLSGASAQALWRRVHDLIWQRIDDQSLCPQTLAQLSRVSLRRLQEVFKRHGTTLSDCIWDTRLEYARTLLVSPSHRDQSVTTLAYNAGFSDVAHFSKRFKQQFGTSPKEYRAMQAH